MTTKPERCPRCTSLFKDILTFDCIKNTHPWHTEPSAQGEPGGMNVEFVAETAQGEPSLNSKELSIEEGLRRTLKKAVTTLAAEHRHSLALAKCHHEIGCTQCETCNVIVEGNFWISAKLGYVKGEPSTASGPTLGTCQTADWPHVESDFCTNWVAGQTVEKQVAPNPLEYESEEAFGEAYETWEKSVAAQPVQPLSTQDETAEPFDLELAKRCKQWLDDHVLVALPGLMALVGDKERKAYASSRLSAALAEERAKTSDYWNSQLAAAEKELERLRELRDWTSKVILQHVNGEDYEASLAGVIAKLTEHTL